jgi:hypothetical protein
MSPGLFSAVAEKTEGGGRWLCHKGGGRRGRTKPRLSLAGGGAVCCPANPDFVPARSAHHPPPLMPFLRPPWGRTDFFGHHPKKLARGGEPRRETEPLRGTGLTIFDPGRRTPDGRLFLPAPKKSPFLAPQKSQKSLLILDFRFWILDWGRGRGNAPLARKKLRAEGGGFCHKGGGRRGRTRPRLSLAGGGAVCCWALDSAGAKKSPPRPDPSPPAPLPQGARGEGIANPRSLPVRAEPKNLRPPWGRTEKIAPPWGPS